MTKDYELDNTFGVRGVKTIDICGNDKSYSVVLDNDKIIVAGNSDINNGDVAVVRLNTDGSYDTSFGDNSSGIKTIDISGHDLAYSVNVTNDNITLVGYSLTNNFDFAVIRLDSSGNLDNSFNSSGKKIIDISGGGDIAYSVVDASDSIIVVGRSIYPYDNDLVVLKLDVSGALDPSFGEGGIKVIDISGYAYSVVVDNSNNIIVAGGNNVDDDDFVVIRLDSSGNPDSNFGVDGIKVIDISNGSVDSAYSIVVDDNNRIIVAGISDINNGDFAVVRLNTDGSYDNSFGDNGIKTIDIHGQSYDNNYSVTLDKNNNIILVGSVKKLLYDDYDFVVIRLDSSGNPDSDFFVDGIKVIDIFGEDEARSVVVDDNNNIIVAGYSEINNGDFAVVRLREKIILKGRGFRIYRSKPYEWLKRRYFTINQ